MILICLSAITGSPFSFPSIARKVSDQLGLSSLLASDNKAAAYSLQ